MTRKNRMKEFVPGRGYTKEDWDDADSPELTDEQIAKGKPFAEAFPDLAESIKRGRGRPPVAVPLQQISIRLEPAVIEKFKATGKGWQARVNDVLKKAKVG
ncbi:MAG: hypothetical protein EOS07_23130 [Mesorhizobium sp.]|jgi:uncharacterized protein (DUF4415 family)|uniref:BrnA antitoxin family protein n=1 Tax=Mesorhizobium sp. TaxID=1871066 RepID=UPI000FE2ACDF|nr:BrnA antitoxin family protein [Mesorhizobium sp.]RWB05217.1 MAG: hypothetical protein EOQ33_09965 [Mesorhizobium sp.]RWB95248.1 MAG: hypothetical protein EOQ56_28945 [Mesorhizobium sp.]RWO05959.1 MAG: hypothetical protein EOS07_23130 [Mesorhizobium sp.]RWP27080.1 MAG: hypothetical protein EOR02_24275 [Mesorhizobium sp.]RWP39084.1 MAG: hypothetical protein EOR04_24360 [Mesorhizobium sp.]